MQRDREFESLLLDYYGDLLTRHQYDVLDEYFNEDLSMNEIADNLEISKSAVQDLIRRSLNQLKEYEKKLNLISDMKKLDIVLEEMKKQDDLQIRNYAEQIEKIMK